MLVMREIWVEMRNYSGEKEQAKKEQEAGLIKNLCQYKPISINFSCRLPPFLPAPFFYLKPNISITLPQY